MFWQFFPREKFELPKNNRSHVFVVAKFHKILLNNAPKKSCSGKFPGVLVIKSISKYVAIWKTSFNAQ